jgi:hypothetical protein
MLVLSPEPIDHAPLQFEDGEIMELPVLTMLALVSVLAVDLTDELGERPLLRGTTGTGRGA